MPENNNCYLIDWFSASCFVDDYSDLFDILGFNNLEVVSSFQFGYGHHGYGKSVFFNGLYIYHDYFDDPCRCWIEMSGTGCRTFETYSEGVTFNDLFQRCVGVEPFFKINRVDVAYDIYDDCFIFDRMKSAVSSGCVISKFGSYEITEGQKLQGGVSSPDFIGRTLYFGSSKSDLLFRLYDKKLERKRDDIDSWYRWEMVFHRDKALELVTNLINSDNVGAVFTAYLNQYISVRERSFTDSNYRRWDVPEWWRRFVDTSESVKPLSKKDESYNVYNAQFLIEHQYGNTIDVILRTLGADALIDLVNSRAQQLNLKQLNAIRLYNLEKGRDSLG